MGNDNCPNCGSSSWKTAKMIVLEGTTISTGGIGGQLEDVGRLSGGFREYLLADRWFSWDKKFEAEFESETTSALVRTVRKFILAQASGLQLPVGPPQLPTEADRPKISEWERVTPIVPTKPSEPHLAELPQARPWYSFFWQSIPDVTFWVLVVVALVSVLGPDILMSEVAKHGEEAGLEIRKVLYLGMFALLLGLVAALVRSFGANQRQLVKAQQINTLALERYRTACERYERDIAQYKLDCQRMNEQQRKYADAKEQFNQKKRHFDQQMKEYKEQEQQVLSRRELLWERARVCLRCGTAYLCEVG